MKIGDTEVHGLVISGSGVLLIVIILFLLGVTNVIPALNFYGTGGEKNLNENTENGVGTNTATNTENENTGVVGEGLLNELAEGVEAAASARVAAQPAGARVVVTDVRLPQEGWVVVHEVLNGHVANALGAAREEAGAHESVTVELLRGTVSGGEYVVVLYADNGNGEFELRADQPIVDAAGDPIIVPFTATL